MIDVLEFSNNEPRLTTVRAEYWRRELAEAVASAAKHGSPEHVDNRLNALVREVYHLGYNSGVHA